MTQTQTQELSPEALAEAWAAHKAREEENLVKCLKRRSRLWPKHPVTDKTEEFYRRALRDPYDFPAWVRRDLVNSGVELPPQR